MIISTLRINIRLMVIQLRFINCYGNVILILTFRNGITMTVIQLRF
jgi:hypothetical protein